MVALLTLGKNASLYFFKATRARMCGTLMILGIFWKALPRYGFGKKGSQCKGVKKAKERVSVALIANTAVGKKTSVVVWTSS